MMQFELDILEMKSRGDPIRLKYGRPTSLNLI